MKRVSPTTVSLIAGLILLPAVLAIAPSFLQVTAATAQTTGEPRLYVDPNDPGAAGNPATAYVVSPEAGSLIWRTTDGGASWTQLINSLGAGGDSDIAIDAAGTIYVADLLDANTASTIPVSVSTNGLGTWAYVTDVVPGASGIEYDRQWIAANGTGTVVVTARAGGSLNAFTSTDSAVTFSGPVTISTTASIAGPLTYAPGGGDLWTIYDDAGTNTWAKSTDDGATWTTGVIAANQIGTVLFPVLDVDASGNVYAVWSSLTSAIPLTGIPMDSEVRFSKSTDGGATWSTPVPLSSPTKANAFPWLSAGAAGKVDVTWIEADDTLTNGALDDIGPDLGIPTTEWSIRLAQSLDADAAFPTWTTVTAAEAFHHGSICTSGLLCLGPQNLGIGNIPTPFDRRHLDFFGFDTDGEGNALISYTKDRPFPGVLVGDLILSWNDVVVARQNGGDVIV